MKPFIRKKLPFILIIVQVILILGLLIYIVPGRYRLYNIVLYDASENFPDNPLIGYAPEADHLEDCENTSLVFITLPFSEWEPEEGVFDTASLEEKYHIQEHREKGRHAVLRFVCDIPSREEHMDIPRWLYDKTGGFPYQEAEGRGLIPDYGNEYFLQAHAQALKKLAEWCRQDSFVAYVEIGSVGHKGRWPSASSSDPGQAGNGLSADVLSRYAAQYAESFPADCGIRLLSSDDTGAVEGAGSWNIILGERDKDKGLLSENLWEQAPVGSSITDSVSMDEILMDNLSDTLEQIRKYHISYIGPECPDAEQQMTNGSEMILRNVGYCFYLNRLQTTMDFIDDDLLFHFTFANIGNVPAYWNWPVTMYVFNRKGVIIHEQTLDLELTRLQPGSEMTVTGAVPYSKELLKGFSVGISITSEDHSEYITLAQKGVIPDGRGIHRVYKYKGKGPSAH